MAPLKVLIIGGGISGPALAFWLARIGANITLIERSPRMRASGQQVDIRAQGVAMMRKMGIEAAVREACVHEPGAQFIDVKGRTQAFLPATQNGAGKQSFTSEFEIMRGDLVRILYRLTEGRPNVQHLYNTTVDSFTQDEESDPNGKVHVRFHDGRTEDFDLVVGADGAGSKTRKAILGPDAPDPRHPLGGYIGYFSIRSTPADSDRATFCPLPGPRVARIIGTRKDCPELTRVYMILLGPDAAIDAAYKTGDLAELKKAWSDLYQGGGWECDRFMEALRHQPEADDLYCTPFEEVRLPEGSWSKGRVVLVGDAAHCQTAGGLGSTWGMIGPYILAGEIATLSAEKSSSLSSTSTAEEPAPAKAAPATAPTTAIASVVIQAAKNYETKFRPAATAMHGGSERIGLLSFPRSKLGIWILLLLAKVAAYLRLDQKLGLFSDTHQWQLPEYPALEKAERTGESFESSVGERANERGRM
ncbi:oxidoreductase [Fonsecaea pedrosoi]|nr:oxidoreductase [Fonsecaea pedrosoi]